MDTTKLDAAMAKAHERRKSIWERHAQGETYAAIAQALGISEARASELGRKWERARLREVAPTANVRAEPQ